LSVIPIHIPALRERKADIPPLIEFLLERFAAKGKALSVSPRAMSIFMDHDWPGNVRELENVLEHAMVCSRGNMIEPDALPDSLRMGHGGHPQAVRRSHASASPLNERERLRRALEASRWNRGLAAARLGIYRTTLWRKMRRLEIRAPQR